MREKCKYTDNSALSMFSVAVPQRAISAKWGCELFIIYNNSYLCTVCFALYYEGKSTSQCRWPCLRRSSRGDIDVLALALLLHLWPLRGCGATTAHAFRHVPSSARRLDPDSRDGAAACHNA